MKQQPALYYNSKNRIVHCHLCPHECTIRENRFGVCKVRKNIGGELYTLNYGKLSAVNFDPVEKKPLYHFFPGHQILSIGSVGCNMKCKCCQNWQISQSSIQDFPFRNLYSPQDIKDIAASREENIGVAYTYNEPTIWYEFMLDTAKLVSEAGLKNVVVSNGYINEEPLLELLDYVDAFNIDLKGFTGKFYRSVTGADLEPVKRTLTLLARNRVHFEITTLVIPSLNDGKEQFDDMINWIASNLGSDTILHLSRYFPMYKMDYAPTSNEILEELCDRASKKLHYVYAGNADLENYRDTHCDNCGRVLVRRTRYDVQITGLNETGNCKYCNNPVIKR